MKRRILNKRGKITLTILTILVSAIIYILMGILATKGNFNIIYQIKMFCGYTWLFLGQFGVYYFIWGKEM